MSELLINFTSNYVPTQITGTNELFQQVTFYGYSGFNVSGIPNTNSSNYYVGKTSGQLYIDVAAGDYVSFQLPSNRHEALNNCWIAGKLNDKAYLVYYN